MDPQSLKTPNFNIDKYAIWYANYSINPEKFKKLEHIGWIIFTVIKSFKIKDYRVDIEHNHGKYYFFIYNKNNDIVNFGANFYQKTRAIKRAIVECKKLIKEDNQNGSSKVYY